jgi:hypothetical protein
MLRFLGSILVTSLLLGATVAWSLRQPKAWGDDLVQDYLSAQALLRGEDPYQDLVLMREQGGFPPNGGEPLHVNPHPPVAILLTIPYTSLPFEKALLVSQIVQILALGIAWNWAWIRFDRGGWIAAFAGGLLGFWAPVWQGIDWGQPIGLIALSTMILWHLAQTKNSFFCGLSMSLICTLRPFFVIISAAAMRWSLKDLVLGVIGGMIGSAIAFALVGITPWDWYSRASVAGRYTNDCGSVAGIFHLGTNAGIVFYLCAWLGVSFAHYRGLSLDATVAIAITAGMLTYPLAWYQYDVCLIPVLVWFGLRSHQLESRVGFMALCLYIAMRAIPNLSGNSELQLLLQVKGRAVLLLGLIWIATRKPIEK